jgi:hypothetical protein
MKKVIAAAILFGVSVSAQAAEKMYATVGIGSASNFGTAFSVAGGYQVATIPTAGKDIPVAAEVGYQSFGSKDYGFGISVSASAFYGAAAGSLEIANDLSATAKLGLASVSAEVVGLCGFATTCKFSDSSIELLYGIGINYSLEKAMRMPLSVGAEYNDYGGESVFGVRASLRF